MAAFLDRLASSSRPLWWLESTRYAARLLAGGTPPWNDPAAVLAWQRKAQSLLRSDVLSLPVAAPVVAWLATHADLPAAMRAKSRLLFPLKTLLADESLRVHLVELIRNLRASFVDLPLLLILPAPRAWIALACVAAHGVAPEQVIEDDDVDSAAMYMADFLRAFGDSGIDALVLEDDSTHAPLGRSALELWRPIRNIASHYRWDLGVRGMQFAADIDLRGAGINFAVAPQALNTCTGLSVDPAIWASDALPELAHSAFRYAGIPESAQPEQVLARLAALRA